MRLINADALLAEVAKKSYTDDLPTQLAVGYAMAWIREAPEVKPREFIRIEKPVVDVDTWKCGNCGHRLEAQEKLGDNVLFHELYRYCPNCGRMVGWDVADKC